MGGGGERNWQQSLMVKMSAETREYDILKRDVAKLNPLPQVFLEVDPK